MTDKAAAPLLTRALEALEQQRSALVAGDSAAIVSTGEQLALVLADLRAVRGQLSQQDLSTLKHAATALTLNATLLTRVSSANQRALNTLFEPASTYALPGNSKLANPSRALHSA